MVPPTKNGHATRSIEFRMSCHLSILTTLISQTVLKESKKTNDYYFLVDMVCGPDYDGTWSSSVSFVLDA